jgi:hypothetical protein
MDEESYQRKLSMSVERLVPDIGKKNAPAGASNPVPIAPLPQPAPRPAKPNVGLVAGIVAVVLLLLVGVAGGAWYLGTHQHPKDEVAQNTDSDKPNQAPSAPTEAPPAPTTPPVATVGPQDGQNWQNSLGMSFVPAGTPNVLFCIYDVQVKDYQAFVDATNFDAGNDWKSPGFQQGPDHPVVNVSWNDAGAFCKWLTDKEQKDGVLGKDQSYRLPTDAEWSKAVGLDESADGTPESKDGKIQGIYPWGGTYPPPPDAGNYNRKEDGRPKSTDNTPDCSDSDIEGTDGYPYTSPVGQFKANSFGLYDMGGNVDQWCEDWFNDKHVFRLVRGGNWDSSGSDDLNSSGRLEQGVVVRDCKIGFRIVVVVAPPQ